MLEVKLNTIETDTHTHIHICSLIEFLLTHSSQVQRNTKVRYVTSVTYLNNTENNNITADTKSYTLLNLIQILEQSFMYDIYY